MRLITATAMAMLMTTGIAAAQDFPTRTVTLVSPYSPGGSTDLLARQLASDLQELWGQTVIVENRPGAGSMIGAAYVAQSAPDGYTLLLNTAAQSTAPAVQTDLPFDPEADLTAVAMVATSPYVLVAGSEVQAETFAELLAEASERPLFFATAGVGSSSHFVAELLIQQAGLDADIVHFGGGGEANVALMGGHADLYSNTTASVMPYVNNGQVTAVGVLGMDRYDMLPDVESSAENNIDGIEIDGWVGLFAPSGVDPQLIESINADVNEAIRTPTFQAVLEANFVREGDTTPAEFQAQVETETALWRALAEERNIVAQ